MKFTKIVATLGPASDKATIVESMIRAGVNVFRFNMKHGSVEWHEERIDLVRSVASRLRKHVGVLIDLQGPEIRVKIPGGESLHVMKRDKVYFTDKPRDIYPSVIIPFGAVIDSLKKGDEILIDDGFQEFDVVGKRDGAVIATAREEYTVYPNKGVNLPKKFIDLPSLNSLDRDRLDVAIKHGVDFIALSFSRTKKDIEILRKELTSRSIHSKIIAKLESQQALDNVAEIIESADGIMVARGDLGVEVPYEELAYWQKKIVEMARIANKPVIVATQMLESMKENPRPTRAEATDVANAVLDGADALMLSGETAWGKYPLGAVKAMAKIGRYNEGKVTFPEKSVPRGRDTELVVDAAAKIATSGHGNGIDAVVVFTETGYTARVMSSYRLKKPIIAVTPNESAARALALSYGSRAVLTQFPSGVFKMPSEIFMSLKRKKLVKAGDVLLVLHGEHWRRPGFANSLSIVHV